MKYVIAGLIMFGGPVLADAGVSEAKKDVLACVTAMGKETTWDQCRGLIFEPCVGESVGSDAHIECLKSQKSEWVKVMDLRRKSLEDVLTAEGANLLGDLITQWTKYVAQNCAVVGEQRAHISAESAQTGCEITEIVGITSEFEAWLDRTSTSPYCTIQD